VTPLGIVDVRTESTYARMPPSNMMPPFRFRAAALLGAFFPALFLALALGFGAAACRSKQCVPGQQIACPCPGAEQGAQVCDEEGARYLACVCPEAPAETGARGPETTLRQPPPARPKKQVRCGGQTCDGACCVTFDPPSCAQDPRTCPRTDNGEAVVFECDGPEDCGGAEACCLVPGDRTIASVCVPRAECAGTFEHPRYKTKVSPHIVCRANLDCPVSQLCAANAAAPGLSTCQ
jgi:hypothetical protein